MNLKNAAFLALIGTFLRVLRVTPRGSVKLAVEPQDKSGRKSRLSAGRAAEGVEILKSPGLADAKDDSIAGIGLLAGIHPAEICAPIQVAVRTLHQSASRRAAIGVRAYGVVMPSQEKTCNTVSLPTGVN